MVHQYKLNGYNIVLDVCSGSVHVVDEVAYDIIEMYKTHSEDEIVKFITEKYAAESATIKEKFNEVKPERDLVRLEIMNRFAEHCQDYASLEKPAKMEGRNMLMFLAPKSSK